MTEDDIIFEEKDNGAWIPAWRSPAAWYGAYNDTKGQIRYPEFGNLQLTARGLTFDPQFSILSSGRGILHLPTKDMISVKLNNEGTSLSGFKIFLDGNSSHTDVAFKVKEPALWIEHLKAILTTRAFHLEKALDYERAATMWDEIGKPEEAARVRRVMYDEKKVDQTVVHGDYVDDRDTTTTYIDDRDTIIKDSVVSKSNIGAGGKSKAEQIKEIKELLDSGAISEEDYQKMKREIVG